MRSGLYPGELSESVYGFDFDKAVASGIKGVLFDIDNTLVPHDAPADQRSIAFLSALREKGLRLGLVSNNREPRVKAFSEACGGIDYVFLAKKPSPEGYRRLCAMLGIREEEALFFGDQLFTDIWGANNAGIRSVLVEPVDKSSDLPRIRFKRILERPILFMYKKEHKGKKSF